MFNIFEREVKQGERMPDDLLSLRSPADDDLLSKKIAYSSLTFSFFKVSPQSNTIDMG